MNRDQNRMSSGPGVLLLAVLLAIALERGLVSDKSWYGLLLFLLPVLVFTLYWGRKDE